MVAWGYDVCIHNMSILDIKYDTYMTRVLSSKITWLLTLIGITFSSELLYFGYNF